MALETSEIKKKERKRNAASDNVPVDLLRMPGDNEMKMTALGMRSE